MKNRKKRKKRQKKTVQAMKNKTSSISTSLLLFAFATGAFFASPVSAQENSLIVEFENTPLFSEANFLPGNSVTRFAKVTNNTEETKSIIIEAINTTGSSDLGDVLNIKIMEGATVLYNDTLSNFFGVGETFLSELAGNGVQTQYDITVSFQSLASDSELWEKSLSFDVLIGFQGEEEVAEPPPIGGGSIGGGGGRLGTASSPRGLTIPSETVRVTDINETSVTVLWDTSFFSTSQVIYAAEGEPRALDLSAPNYGYPHAAPDPEDVNKVLFHSVTITGLIPETTYYFRVVSYASPPTISREHNFETLALGGGIEIAEFGEDSAFVPAGGGEPGDLPIDADVQEADNGDTIEKTTAEPEESQEEQKNIFEIFGASAVSGIFTPGTIALIAGILLILFFLRKKRKKKISEAKTSQP